MAELLLAVDPGREKTGVALAKLEGTQATPLFLRVLPTASLQEDLAKLAASVEEMKELTTLVLGDGTNHKTVAAVLTALWPALPLHMVEEGHSTEEARQLYFEMRPPEGWRKLLPRGLLVPKEPLDAHAALVLARRFAAKKTGS